MQEKSVFLEFGVGGRGTGSEDALVEMGVQWLGLGHSAKVLLVERWWGGSRQQAGRQEAACFVLSRGDARVGGCWLGAQTLSEAGGWAGIRVGEERSRQPSIVSFQSQGGCRAILKLEVGWGLGARWRELMFRECPLYSGGGVGMVPGSSVDTKLQESSSPLSSQLLSCVQLFATPWTAACQVSLSITNSRRLLKLMSVKSMIQVLYRKCHSICI